MKVCFWQQTGNDLTAATGDFQIGPDSTQTSTLWPCETCTWLSSYMSQPVVWTSQCKAISLSVPPPTHPTPVSFPPYPNKSCFSGKSVRPLMFLQRDRSWSQAASPVIGTSVYKRQSNSRRLDAQMFKSFRIPSLTQSAHNLAYINTQVEVFHKNQEETRLYCTQRAASITPRAALHCGTSGI